MLEREYFFFTLPLSLMSKVRPLRFEREQIERVNKRNCDKSDLSARRMCMLVPPINLLFRQSDRRSTSYADKRGRSGFRVAGLT